MFLNVHNPFSGVLKWGFHVKFVLGKSILFVRTVFIRTYYKNSFKILALNLDTYHKNKKKAFISIFEISTIGLKIYIYKYIK